MKYGHLQTDPYQIDEWHHGDPKLPEQYHPALGPDDYPKFHSDLWHLLPAGATDSGFDPWFCFDDSEVEEVYDPYEPFTDIDGDGYTEGVDPFTDVNANGVRDDGSDSFHESCAFPESLDSSDFTRAAAFLGGAANKTRRITVDLAQYFNRIMKITKTTGHTLQTLDRLPALVRECGVEDGWDEPTGEDQEEPPYTEECSEYPATPGIHNGEHFPDVLEEFVNFEAADYDRPDWRNVSLEVIKPLNPGVWKVDPAVPLLGWLAAANPGGQSGENIQAFVRAASDSLRSIEFIHNYAIPDDLGWNFTEAKVKDKEK